jgi:hypothetical protein
MKRLNRWLISKLQITPLLLTPLLIIYLVLSFTIKYLLTHVTDWMMNISINRLPVWFEDGILTLFIVALPLSLICAWGHFLYITLASITPTSRIKGNVKQVLRVLQILVVVVIIFAAAHYCLHLLSGNEAYAGMSPIQITEHKPLRGFPQYIEGSMKIIDSLYSPGSPETIADCIYFSTVTTATIGYGDIYPKSVGARILTTIQIIVSFGLVIVILGWAMGHPDN